MFTNKESFKNFNGISKLKIESPFVFEYSIVCSELIFVSMLFDDWRLEKIVEQSSELLENNSRLYELLF